MSSKTDPEKTSSSHLALAAMHDASMDPNGKSRPIDRPVSIMDTIELFNAEFKKQLTEQAIYLLLPETSAEFDKTLEQDMPYFVSLANLIRSELPKHLRESDKDIEYILKDQRDETGLGLNSGTTVKMVFKDKIAKLPCHELYQNRYGFTRPGDFGWEMHLKAGLMQKEFWDISYRVLQSAIKEGEDIRILAHDQPCMDLVGLSKAQLHHSIPDTIQIANPFTMAVVYERGGVHRQTQFNVIDQIGDMSKDSVFIINEFEHCYCAALVKLLHNGSERSLGFQEKLISDLNKAMHDRVITLDQYKDKLRQHIPTGNI